MRAYCTATGDPLPSLTWQMPGARSSYDDVVIVDGGTPSKVSKILYIPHSGFMERQFCVGTVRHLVAGDMDVTL